MKITKPILLLSLILFSIGVLFGLLGSALGGNVFRASKNIDRLMDENIIFEFIAPTPQPTPVPHSDPFGDIFGDSDIFDIFENFGISPYDSYYEQNPGKSGSVF